MNLRQTTTAFVIVLALIPITVLFQNCGEGFLPVGVESSSSISSPRDGQSAGNSQLQIKSPFQKETLTHVVPLRLETASDIQNFDIDSLILQNATAVVKSTAARLIELEITATLRGSEFGVTVSPQALQLAKGALKNSVTLSHVWLDRSPEISALRLCDYFAISDNHILCNNGPIWNITDSANPVLVADMGIQADSGFTKSGNIIIANQYSRLDFHDISNPQAPILRGSFNLDLPGVVHVVGGGLLVVEREADFQLINIQNPTQPTLVTFFGGDITPIEVAPGFTPEARNAGVICAIGNYIVQNYRVDGFVFGGDNNNDFYRVFELNAQGATLVNTYTIAKDIDLLNGATDVAAITSCNGENRLARPTSTGLEVYAFNAGQISLERKIPGNFKPINTFGGGALAKNIFTMQKFVDAVGDIRPATQIDVSNGQAVVAPANFATLATIFSGVSASSGFLRVQKSTLSYDIYDYRANVNQTPVLSPTRPRIHAFGNPGPGLVVGDSLITISDSEISAFSITKPSLKPTSRVPIDGYVYQVLRFKDYLIALGYRKVFVIYFPSPNVMSISTTITIPVQNGSSSAEIYEAAIRGNFIYLTIRNVGGTPTLRTYNLANPAAPVLVSEIQTSSTVDTYYSRITIINDRYMYLRNFGILRAYDLINPAAPAPVGEQISATLYLYDVAINGALMYSPIGAGIQIWDVSDPLNITMVNEVLFSEIGVTDLTYITSLKIIGPYLYIAGNRNPHAITVLNVANPQDVKLHQVISTQAFGSAENIDITSFELIGDKLRLFGANFMKILVDFPGAF